MPEITQLETRYIVMDKLQQLLKQNFPNQWSVKVSHILAVLQSFPNKLCIFRLRENTWISPPRESSLR
jgi:DNA polymerase sigma